MAVSFRNVDVDPTGPVDRWPYEAIVTIIERGTLGDWLLLTRAFDDDPWGSLARQVEDYLEYERPYGVGPLLERAIGRARRQAEVREKTAVAGEVADLVGRSGLRMAEVASRIGTSRTRLSTYRSGTVVPSAALLVRLRLLVARVEGAPPTNRDADENT